MKLHLTVFVKIFLHFTLFFRRLIGVKMKIVLNFYLFQKGLISFFPDIKLDVAVLTLLTLVIVSWYGIMEGQVKRCQVVDRIIQSLVHLIYSLPFESTWKGKCSKTYQVCRTRRKSRSPTFI